jgi:hypothetical protein
MSKLWNAKVHASMGGRSATDDFTNEFLYRAADNATPLAHRTMAAALCAALAPILVSRARISRVVLSPQNAPGVKDLTPGDHITVLSDVVGTKVLAQNVDPALLSFVAVFGKNADVGFAGRLNVRGSFAENEVLSSADLSPDLGGGFNPAPFTAFANAIRAVFSDNGFELVLPAARNQNYITGARPVVSVAFQGVSMKQRRNNRKTLEQARRDLARREMADTTEAIDLLRYDVNGNIQDLTVALLAAAVPLIQKLINVYGIPFLLKSGMPPLLKAALLVLGLIASGPN